MKGALVRSGAWLLTAALLGQAGAQDLGAYQQLKTSLNDAVQDRAFSKGRSLSDLQKAQQALDTLKPTVRNEVLKQGLDDTLSAARASLARSPADLEAQVTQARGLMRAVLYAQTLPALNAGNAANQGRLLADEFGLSAAASSSFLKFVGSNNLTSAQRLLEQAAARKVQGYLGAVNLADRAGAYLNLTRAASWFTAVQGAPAASALQVSQFAGALSAVTSGDTASARSALQTLQRGAASFVQSARGVPAASAQPQQTVPVTPAPTSPAQTPVAAPTAGQVAAPANPAVATPPAPSSPVEQVYADLGRALAAASVADQPSARRSLQRAEQALGQAGRLSSAPAYEALALNLRTMSNRSGLRPSDVQVLIGQLDNAEAQVAGQPASVLNAGAAGAARGLGGGVRAVLFLLFSLLSAYPLYLLNLAFGSRNPYWRAIFGGLVLLLLPALLEGVGGFLGFLGDLSNVGALRSLTNLSLTQNAWGGVVWGLSLALALVALTYGFRGLCLQFGLLGGARPLQAETQTSLEWDEEI
ncbi:hypothetical protein [Deinococcus irradiatisoli]|uniref:hypothetical protein n=1 Tax=Deinococcus irradiatisoli TaxID=2202254 RepID=UPI001FE56AFE|nr:hypothetical protein [Deinococcus irradiatisoli]